MPHQCTNCSETFPDGSKEMLSGCPRCGGNTFQYLPEGSAAPTEEEPPEPPEPPGANSSVTETVGKAATTVRDYVNQRRTEDPSTTPSSVTDSGPEPEPESTGASASDDPLDDAEVSSDPKSSEDTAQASARGELADASDLPDGSVSADSDSTDRTMEASDSGFEPARPPEDAGDGDGSSSEAGEAPPREDGRVVKQPDSPDRPDLETLREELNDQFESIKILEPGQYELNLMGLYDREEHIIALQEDGKYMIEVPETWRENQPDRTED